MIVRGRRGPGVRPGKVRFQAVDDVEAYDRFGWFPARLVPDSACIEADMLGPLPPLKLRAPAIDR